MKRQSKEKTNEDLHAASGGVQVTRRLHHEPTRTMREATEAENALWHAKMPEAPTPIRLVVALDDCKPVAIVGYHGLQLVGMVSL